MTKENSKCPESTQEIISLRIYGRKSGRKLLREKKGYWEGTCGTGKQQVPGQHPGEFTDAKAAGNCSARKKGTGRALAVLE